MPNKQANLLTDLGSRYVSEHFRGALFMHDGKIHSCTMADGNTLYASQMYEDRPGYFEWKDAQINGDSVRDFTFFKYPKLGYRNVLHPHTGENEVINLTLRRSTRRGLTPDNLLAEPMLFSLTGVPDAWQHLNTAARANLIFNPKYLKFSEALPQLLAGDIASAALSSEACVVLATDRSTESEFIILFRGRVVGTVQNGGALELSNKAARRGSLISLLNE